MYGPGAEGEGQMKQKSELETGLKVGDRVRLIAQTLPKENRDDAARSNRRGYRAPR